MKYNIIHYTTLDSTNTEALSLAREGAKEGTVISSDFQKKGRGRFRRKWVSRRGENLLFSIILRPKHGAHQISLLTHYAARAIKNGIEDFLDIHCTIKRPNDVLIHGKKVCGILTESLLKARDVEHIVVGIGINVNSTSRTLLRGATSLREEIGEKVEKDALLHCLLKHFKKEYSIFTKKK